MTLQPPDAGRHLASAHCTPRLRLKPKTPKSGYVGGAWWPHSDDLTKELPDLLIVPHSTHGTLTIMVLRQAADLSIESTHRDSEPFCAANSVLNAARLHTLRSSGTHHQRRARIVVSSNTEKD